MQVYSMNALNNTSMPTSSSASSFGLTEILIISIGGTISLILTYFIMKKLKQNREIENRIAVEDAFNNQNVIEAIPSNELAKMYHRFEHDKIKEITLD